MFKKCITAVGVLAISGAALLLSPATSLAQHHGGGHGGGGHSGGGHAGSFHGSSGWHGGGDWHGSGNGFWWGLGTGYALGSFSNGYYGGYPYYGRYYSPYYYSPYDYSDVGPYYGDNVMYSTSAYPPAPSNDDRARLTIRVPSDRSDVWIEGQKTAQDKPTDNYVSPPLTPGKKYYYEVRAQWTDRDGKAMDETRTFPIYAGKPVMVDFSRPAPSAREVRPPRE